MFDLDLIRQQRINEQNIQNGIVQAKDAITMAILPYLQVQKMLDYVRYLTDMIVYASGLGSFKHTQVTYTSETQSVRILFADAYTQNICKQRTRGSVKAKKANGNEQGTLSAFVDISAVNNFGTAEFYTQVVTAVADWLCAYSRLFLTRCIIDDINTQLSLFMNDCVINYHIAWDIGPKIQYVDDDSVVFGTNPTDIVRLQNTFREIYSSERLSELFKDTLKSCIRPYDLFFIKNEVTQELGIYTQWSLSTCLRTVYSFDFRKQRMGCGYVHTKDYFAVVQATALPWDNAERLPNSAYYVVKNEKPTRTEQKQNKDAIAYRFVIRPVGEYGVPYNASLADVVAVK